MTNWSARGHHDGWLRRGALALEQESDRLPRRTAVYAMGSVIGVFGRLILMPLPAQNKRNPHYGKWDMTPGHYPEGQDHGGYGYLRRARRSTVVVCASVTHAYIFFSATVKPIPKYLRGGSRPEIIQSRTARQGWNGDAFRSGGHYAHGRSSARTRATSLSASATGWDDYCLKCRKAQRTLHRMTSARAAEGKDSPFVLQNIGCKKMPTTLRTSEGCMPNRRHTHEQCTTSIR